MCIRVGVGIAVTGADAAVSVRREPDAAKPSGR